MGGDKKAQQQHTTQSQSYQTQFENEQKQRSAEAYNRSNEAYGGANKLYQDFAQGGGQNILDQAYGSAPGGGGGGGGGGAGGGPGGDAMGDSEASYRKFMGETGGLDPTKFNEYQGTLSELSKTGGWSPEQIANVNKAIGQYQSFAEGGGVDEEGRNRIRGMGVFDEYSKTGGYSDQDKANLRARGTSGIPAFYNRVREEGNRLGRVQGGGGPGQAALMSRLARDESRGVASAARDTELGIHEAVDKGRQWGTTGLSNAETSLQDLLSRNKLAGMAGVTDATTGMANSIGSIRSGAAGQAAGNEANWQGLKTSNQLAGTRGLEGMAEAAASRGLAASAQSSADARWRASFLADNMLAGAGGLRGLRTDVPGEVALYDQNRLQSRQIWNQGAGAAPQGGGTDWGALAGAGAIGAGTYFGGQAGGGGGGNTNIYAGGSPEMINPGITQGMGDYNFRY
jgi:hypothetical protein